MLMSVALALLVTTGALAESMPKSHDGFFLRMGLSLGPASTKLTQEVNGRKVGDEFTLSGFSSGYDLMLGGTPAQGLVIGGLLTAVVTSQPSYGASDSSDTINGTMIFAGVGVFANYYLDPAKCLHFQALLGLGNLDLVASGDPDSGGRDDKSASGPFFGGGVGYDFWFSDQWSIGPFGRVVYGVTAFQEPLATTRANYLYPSVGAAFTFH
jgi:hypothetical protein